MSNPFDDLKDDDSEPIESADTSAQSDTADAANTTDTTAATGTPLDGDSESETSDSPPENSSSPNGESDTSRSDDDVTDGSAAKAESESESESVSPAEIGPAFEYSDVQQKPFYARSETVDEFENAIRTTIVPKLAEASVLDEQTREIHDAVLRLANEHPERVAELVLEERRQSEPQ
ncbi:hypothetical protein RBH26_19580 [Natronolimnohabitans sp. A-GB9]|uniref:hypothetical protein n=1 Tax=Natronolimnohabitans sp. A-GB9 TaxID=3069757 RepID=UPI0027B0ED1C|nr:hypothetical protein [Natronolimnohabitans sp. A-GB9]MDQ2052661.1 hypothetical protein [Natronolimnohabitans sp. A-GB9]